MKRKSLFASVALVAGLVLGLVLAPTLRSTAAGAQTTPSTPAQSTTPMDSLRSLFLDKLATALGIDRTALDSAIVSAGNSTADEAVQQGTLTQEQGDSLKQRLQSGDLGALWRSRGKGMGKGIGGAAQQAIVDAAAQALNLSADEFKTQLRSGQTLAQLAQAQGTTEQAVIDAALAAAKTQLDQQVASGALTQERADAIYSELQNRGADLFSHRGGRGGHKHGTTPAPAETPTASPATSTDA